VEAAEGTRGSKKMWQNNGVEALDERIASLSIVHKVE
jgi:hypothetical protein